jgi:hypothetical protein
VRLYVPGVDWFHVMPYGLVGSVPIAVPFAKNWTLLIVPSGSLATAASAIDAGAWNVAPLAGDITETVGGWLTGPDPTLTVSKVDVLSTAVLWLLTAIPM